MPDTLSQRFFSKIAADPHSDCILWAASTTSKGYGQLRVGSTIMRATHVSWFLKYGVWPVRHVLHRCDNPPCINPDHLFEGSNQDNVWDSIAKGRHTNARLEPLERSEMIALSDTGMSLSDVAALFGVSTAYLQDLRRGRSRKSRAVTRCTVGGELLTVAQIAQRAGCTPSAIYARIHAGVVGERLLLRRYDVLRGY